MTTSEITNYYAFSRRLQRCSSLHIYVHVFNYWTACHQFSYFIIYIECYHRQEIHMLKVESDLDVDKLGLVDKLANLIGKEGVPFVFADLSLKEIAVAPPAFGKQWRLFGFAASASMSAPLFFDGTFMSFHSTYVVSYGNYTCYRLLNHMSIFTIIMCPITGSCW